MGCDLRVCWPLLSHNVAALGFGRNGWEITSVLEVQV